MESLQKTHARLVKGLRAGIYRLHLNKAYVKQFSFAKMSPGLKGTFLGLLVTGALLVGYGFFYHWPLSTYVGFVLVVGDLVLVKRWEKKVRAELMEELQNNPAAFDWLYAEEALTVEVVSTGQKISHATGDWKAFFQEEEDEPSP